MNKKGAKAKSPKADKKGKSGTTWDPFVFGGKGATGEEARGLERGPKGGKSGADDDTDTDNEATDRTSLD